MINDQRIKLALLLQDNYNRDVIINFGGMPQITNFLHAVYDYVPRFVIPLIEAKLLEETEISHRIHTAVTLLRDRPLNANIVDMLLDAAKRLTHTFLWVMLNNEIIRRFFHRYLEIFDKNCFDQLLKYDESLGGRMHELLVHPRLINMHHILIHLLEARGLPAVATSQEDEGQILSRMRDLEYKLHEFMRQEADTKAISDAKHAAQNSRYDNIFDGSRRSSRRHQ